MNNVLVQIFFLPLLLLTTLISTSALTPAEAENTIQVVSFRKWRKTQNGLVRCALDTTNETIVSSSLQDCSLSSVRDVTTIGFNLRNSHTSDHVMLVPVLASAAGTRTPVSCTITNRRFSQPFQRACFTRLFPF